MKSKTKGRITSGAAAKPTKAAAHKSQTSTATRKAVASKGTAVASKSKAPTTATKQRVASSSSTQSRTPKQSPQKIQTKPVPNTSVARAKVNPAASSTKASTTTSHSKTKAGNNPVRPASTQMKAKNTQAASTTTRTKTKTSNTVGPATAGHTPASKVMVNAVGTDSKTTVSRARISPSTSPKAKPDTHTAPAMRSTSTATLLAHTFDPYAFRDDEEYMHSNQLAHFRMMLENWKQELMEEVDHTIHEMKEASVTFLADPNDRATQEETFSLELRTRDRERKLIRKIEEALKRIDAKEYGYCESCGIEIGIRRLEARPTAVLCIDCKTLDEIREKRSAQ